ncbi:unnamed protein product [Haemonchus placei]|uniref:Cell division protein ZapB n=1 Tax=Haemonchus placei TaxID=6290 RepID=A0A0N4WX91_HAEPC|nr:unnamed protein product [Haemonchus placei]
MNTSPQRAVKDSPEVTQYVQLEELNEALEMVREQEQQILGLLEMSEMLKSENEQLRQQEEQLKALLEETARNARAKEEELRKEFSDQIGMLIENTAE